MKGMSGRSAAQRVEPSLTRRPAPQPAAAPRRAETAPQAAPRRTEATPQPWPAEQVPPMRVRPRADAPAPAGPARAQAPRHVDEDLEGYDLENDGFAGFPMEGAEGAPAEEEPAEAPMAVAPAAPRRDPAPSRAAYRLQRMWLTPLYRSLLRQGVPAFCVILGLGIWLHDPATRAKLTEWAGELRASVAERPEFMVQLMRIEGASDSTAQAIRDKLALKLPVSSFDVDLASLQEEVLGLDAVARAELHIRKGGVLDVAVTERAPVVVWRNATGIGTLDQTGHPVETLLSRLERPDLPLLVGEGADTHVDEAMALLDAAGPIADRIRGLIRVGDRRWDVIVEPSIRLMLPEHDPVNAFEQIVALNQAQDLLNRDITAVDFRVPARATVRLGAPAADTYRQTTAIFRGAAKP